VRAAASHHIHSIDLVGFSVAAIDHADFKFV